VEDKIRKCLASNFSKFEDKTCSLEKFTDEISIDSLEFANDDYLKYCLYETMRMDPPVPFSTGFTITENLNIGKYKIRAGDHLFSNITKLHHLED
jgi:cytochrome P450